MLPLVFLVLFSGLTYVAIYADNIGAHEKASHLDAEVKASSFLAYRESLIRFMESNPTFTGSVTATDLEPFYPTGFLNPGLFMNYVTTDNLYVYTTQFTDVSKLKEKLHRSLLVGRKSTTGHLISLSGIDTEIQIPSIIPVNAIVIAGH